MITDLKTIQNIFFIGIAGTGMSALAQYLKGIGKNVSGSDRYFKPNEFNDTKNKLEAEGIQCFYQNGEGINEKTQWVIVSTAVEDSVPEVQKAKQLNIPILKRSELLSLITQIKKTIAVAGTSGKSTTSAMLFHILQYAGYEPSIISGAGLVSIIRRGKIGNAYVGKGDWLIIEADESDGSIVQYKPEIGLLLNIDKDHQELQELESIFSIFKTNTKELFVVNQSQQRTKSLSQNMNHDFSTNENPAGYQATHFVQNGLQTNFLINSVPFLLTTIGKHNMENALAASTVANQISIPLTVCAEALKSYEGIYRRHQVLGNKNGVWLIDDYAHNPVKCAKSIEACQMVAPKVIAWFQPHGYGPTRFLKNDFIDEFSKVLRPQDEIWMSEIFYAGGTATKDISAKDLIDGIAANGKNAFFIADRNHLLEAVRSHFTNDCVFLLMGARDPSLEFFGKEVWENL